MAWQINGCIPPTNQLPITYNFDQRHYQQKTHIDSLERDPLVSIVDFFNRLGEIRDRCYENQRYRASSLNLVVAAILLWNTVYLEKAIQALKSKQLSMTAC